MTQLNLKPIFEDYYTALLEETGPHRLIPHLPNEIRYLSRELLSE